MIKILIVDDHLIVREGIKRIINDTQDMRIISEAANGYDAMDLVCKNKYDLDKKKFKTAIGTEKTAFNSSLKSKTRFKPTFVTPEGEKLKVTDLVKNRSLNDNLDIDYINEKIRKKSDYMV